MMEEKLDLLLFDKSDNLIEEIKIKKPKTYYELLDTIKSKIKKLPKYYNISYQKENENVIITNNEQYQLTKDILFIHEVNNLEESIFSLNYNKLSESQQEILDEKFSCNICEENIKDIKNDKPLICYQCQRIYHKRCLEDWDKQCKLNKINFLCPKCKYVNLLKNWKEKVNYEDERNNEVKIMSDMNKLKGDLNDNININKYNSLKNELEIFSENVSKLFYGIFNKINEIILLIDNNNNNKIDNILNKNGFNHPNEISHKIMENLNI